MSEEMKQGTGEVPEAEAKAEGQKLEWGSELGRTRWIDIQDKITEINSKLSEGEKVWRLPTKDELIKAMENQSTQSLFKAGWGYWSNTKDSQEFPDLICDVWFAEGGDKRARFSYENERNSNLVNLVRDTV